MLGGVDDQRPVPLQQPVDDLEVGDELEDAVAAEPPRFVERRGDEAGGQAARRWEGENVSFSITAKMYCRTRPSTKIGIDTPALATTIVPTSAAELRL